MTISIAERMMRMLDDFQKKAVMDELIEEFYSPEAVFEDPVQRAEGIEAIKKVWHSMASIFQNIDGEIIEEIQQGGKLAIHWTMSFKYKYWPVEVTLPGVTLLEMDEDGKCKRHTDYWDLWVFLRRSFPLVKPLERVMPSGLKKLLA